MQILEATITVADLDAAAAFYADVLGLPVSRVDDEARVGLGASVLVLARGPAYDGEHHLAFGVAPEDFESTLAFARARLSPIAADGDDVVVGPESWNSRSVYFRGPEGIVLEYIARDAHRGRHRAAPDGAPRVTCLSEVGIGVTDVPGTVARLDEACGLPPFPPQSDAFAPVGDHDGLLILVDTDRTWFPTEDASAAHGPLAMTVGGAHQTATLDLSATTRVSAQT